MKKFKIRQLIISLVVASVLSGGATLVHAANYTVPVGLLYYNPDSSGSYLFPTSGADMPYCAENMTLGRRYRVTGNISGRADYWYDSTVKDSAIVTLHEESSNRTVQVKITPLGTQKISSSTWGRAFVEGDYCSSSTVETNVYVERSIQSTSSARLADHKGYGLTFYLTLAFELLDPEFATPGIYSAQGGYQFQSNEIEMKTDVNGSYGSPLIPNLRLVIGHIFKIDMPYTSVSLTQSYENDDIFTGKVRFRAQSNERYSIKMTCSSSNSATSGGNCNFASTQMELATQARFPEQGRTFDLRHNIPNYIDGAEFTNSTYEYPGYIDFTLTGVRQYGETGKTYFDTVNLAFEPDF
ncbi:hypothetical protein PTW35_26005 (plasmid) [Photobacterium sp. DA100]|uniref:hypothetical protein n=1 Tax=Photobacterium sp. DA100 TaxID=3027472 RepID=UPI0024794034|nr:hypothetical protein [Photobacterium sp. DA100]WEM44710.1 hypothetical protein PTW35_26005 [Photobacterium sp. DA100]